MKSLLTYRKLIVTIFAILFTLTFHGVSDALTYTHIYVDAVKGVNAPTGRGSAASPYKSITFALLISERNNLPDPWHVHIRPGNYNGDAAKGNAREVFPLKLRQEMIFEGTTTAAECIIDGQHTGETTVPILSGDNTEKVTIRNLTIQNSLRTNGVGGIVLHDPTGTKETPSTLEGCIVHNNKGGGVWSNMPLILTDNTFSNNHWTGVEITKSAAATNNIFSGNHWTGLYLSGDSTGDISENVFRNNRNGRRDAAGLHIKDTLEGNITHNTFEGNEANSGPNGFSVTALTGNVTHNTFKNVDKETGPAFRVHTLTGSIAHNVFIGKSSHSANGFEVGSTLTGDVTRNEFNGMTIGFSISIELNGNVTYNKFIRNKQGFHISNHFTGNMITHNLFDSNSSSTHWAGGFHLRLAKGTVEVSNNIFFNNTGNNANSVHIAEATVHFINNLFMISDELSEGVSSAHTIWVNSPNCRFHNNIFSGVKTAIYTTGTFDLPITHNLFHNVRVDFVEQAGNNLGNDLLFWELLAVNATDNLEGNPRLVDPVTTRDFHLQSTSPAIDAGTNAFAPADDFDGVIRPVGATVDIGPYEYGGTPPVTTQDPPADDTATGGKRRNLFPLTTQEDPIVKLYWATREKIQRADLDGSNVEDVINQGAVSIALDATNGKIYWTQSDNGIYRANLSDGTNVEQLIDDAIVAHSVGGGIALDVAGDKVYWTSGITNGIFRANLDGTQAASLLTPPNAAPLDIALDVAASKMYWTQWGGNANISRAGLDGTNVEPLLNALEVGDIALDTSGDKMYWTNGSNGIGSASLDGSNIKNFETPDFTSGGMTLDLSNGTMYWVDSEGYSIRRSNLDGSEQTTIIEYEGRGPGINDIALYVSVGEIKTEPVVSVEYPAWDVNEDGKTDITDFVMVAAALGTSAPENPRLDVNGDGSVSFQDLILVATHLGETTEPAAPIRIALPKQFTPQTLQQVLDTVRTQSDGSLVFQRAIANLEQLLASLTPKETALLANYPNPFNPETWIPYQLAEPADVTLRIYAVDSSLVRTLWLGHKTIGTYQTRSRAAYWDGRNNVGEPVASGVYFYTLSAGEFTSTRKMLIRK